MGVVSLAGVVLIARPAFLFGGAEAAGVFQAESIVKGGMTERVVAVGYAILRCIRPETHSFLVLHWWASWELRAHVGPVIVLKQHFQDSFRYLHTRYRRTSAYNARSGVLFAAMHPCLRIRVRPQ